MSSTGEGLIDIMRIIEINTSQQYIYSLTFTADGKEVLSGGSDGKLRRWRVDDGGEVGKPIQMGSQILAVTLSLDCKWLVCGLSASPHVQVWDAKTHKKARDIHDHTKNVFSVDVSHDSTRFVTGGDDRQVYIFCMTTGMRLVGPLCQNKSVLSVRFSPDGDRIAVAVYTQSIRIYDSNDGRQLLDIPWSCTPNILSSPLAWSADGSQLFALTPKETKCFDTFSGSTFGTWSISSDDVSSHIALSRSQKFAAVVADRTLSFWDASTHGQIVPVIQHATRVRSMALSPGDDCIATGEAGGKITLQSLHGVLPESYTPMVDVRVLRFVDIRESEQSCSALSLSLILPLFPGITATTLSSWTQGDLKRADKLLTKEIDYPLNPLHCARALAYRALVLTRLKESSLAIDDAKRSVGTQRTIIGHIACAMAHVSDGEHELAMRAFDLVFIDGLSTENNLLLLIKAAILFECGKHDDAISRINDLIDIVDNKSVYITVRAQLFLLLGDISMRSGDYERAVQLLRRAGEAISLKKSPCLITLSLIFGWNFDGLAPTIEQQLHRCVRALEDCGDAAMQTKNPEKAITHYSTALSLNPPNLANLFVKRSKSRKMVELWEDALTDADEAIKADPRSPWGYERRHAALHGLQRYDEAVAAISHMLSLLEESPDQDIRQLAKGYISPAQSEMIIMDIVCDISKTCPPVLIDVRSGHLCDASERTKQFKSEREFFELVSSMILEVDNERILQEVTKYFQYVTFSHVREGKEPSYQDIKLVGSVWGLNSSPQNIKLKNFCEVVREDGYRWAWSDTCCINKTIATMLNQSPKMMYKWYEASAAALVFLADVDSPLGIGSLVDNVWTTLSWTPQEILASNVIRFYDRNWKPYLGDIRTNHRESPEIMQELTTALGVTRETIMAFNPDHLSVREKLRLASTRKATVEEDYAYSLIGIFRSDIQPNYGEGYAALGHLLEETVARSGDMTVLDWAGKSSPYNSCLPATLSVYSQIPHISSPIEDAEMDKHSEILKSLFPQRDAEIFYSRVTYLPPARFSDRRLHLPSIIFPVKKLVEQEFGSGEQDSRGKCYRARVSGIGYVEFQTSDSLSVSAQQKHIFVHPWIHDLCNPFNGFTWPRTSGGDSESSSEYETDDGFTPTSPTMEDCSRALQFIIRLRQPFHALLLQQQPGGEFRRVAAEHRIILPGLSHRVNFAKDILTGVVEVL